MANEKIIVIEDDDSIREVLAITLRAAGFERVIMAADGESGLHKVLKERPDLVLLDLMLPGLDGLEVCRRIRASEECSKTPIIMLTAKSEEADIVLGLELGANDYVTKPFSRKVLVARIHAVLRRPAEEAGLPLRYEDLVLDPVTYEVTLRGRVLGPLTLSEHKILRLLLAHPGRVYTRGQIIEETQGGERASTDRAVDVQIVNLRRKLGSWAEHVETIRGVGYRLA